MDEVVVHDLDEAIRSGILHQVLQSLVNILLQVHLNQLAQVRALVSGRVQFVPGLVAERSDLRVACSGEIRLLEENALAVLQEVLQIVALSSFAAVIFDLLEKRTNPGFH